MLKKHVQAELDPHEYEALQRVVEAEGLSIKEGLREAVRAWVRQRNGQRDPLFDVIGIAGRRGSSDASARHDDIYLED